MIALFVRLAKLLHRLLTGYPPAKPPKPIVYRKNHHRAPAFIVVCGVIAVLYLVYRIASVVVPLSEVVHTIT